MTPAVSVLLPTHNNAPYLRAAVGSVLAQTYSDFELIVIDDASSDETAGLLGELAAQDKRIRVLTNPRPLGIERSLNLALEQAQAALIARMDGDDLCLPPRLERQVAALASQPQVVALGCQVQTFGDVQMRYDYPLTAPEARAHSVFAVPLCHPATLMRRGALEAVGGYPLDAPFAEDYALWARLLEEGEIANLPQVLLRYRRHAESVTSRRAEGMRASTRQVWSRLLGRLGLESGEADLESHDLLAHSYYDPLSVSAQQRAAAQDWGARLIQANALSRFADPAHLAAQVARRLAGLWMA
ncbi:glycosyltransferase family 2 protein [Deinococcus sp.]|uniref:glycosyltransferase family 2 protein n=1 Tax=Deinococcus sp. TaxID=47478 RepID=UPI003CC50FC6